MDIDTQAIVLKRFDYSDSSQVAHVLTATEGRLSLLAKGIKRPNASLKGPMDLFQLARVRYRSSRNSDLALLLKYEPVTGFRGLRRGLERLYAAFYVTELIYEGTRESDEQPELFTLLARALARLEDVAPASAPPVVLATELAFLRLAGFRVALSRCAQCDREAPPRTVRFHPLAGGLVCSACRPSPQGSLDFAPDARALLVALERAGPRHADRIRLSPRQAATLRGLLRAYVTAVLERPLRSDPFVGDARYGFLPALRGRPVTSR